MGGRYALPSRFPCGGQTGRQVPKRETRRLPGNRSRGNVNSFLLGEPRHRRWLPHSGGLDGSSIFPLKGEIAPLINRRFSQPQRRLPLRKGRIEILSLFPSEILRPLVGSARRQYSKAVFRQGFLLAGVKNFTGRRMACANPRGVSTCRPLEGN